MSNLYQLAESRKSDAESRVRDLESQLAQARAEVTAWEEFLGRAKTLMGSGSGVMAKAADPTLKVAPPPDDAEGEKSRSIRADSLTDKVLKLMREMAVPMSPLDIDKELRSRGVVPTSEFFRQAISNALKRRRDLFTRIGDGLYSLAEREANE